jgi:uncharacterized protein (TIGR03435 family)
MQQHIPGRITMFRLRITWTLLLLAYCIPSVHAQMPIMTDSKPDDANVRVPEFEVAAIKQHKDLTGNMMIGQTPNGFRCVNLGLTDLIASAYGVKQDLISGAPGWVGSTRFDIEAKVAAEDADAMKKLNGHQRQAMLKPLLEDRFHLKAHIETKTLPVYELVVAKGGAKLIAAAADPPESPDAKAPDAKPDDHPKSRMGITIGPGSFEGTDVALGTLVGNLGYIVQRTVIDKTGLTGKYDMKLKWTPEDQAMSADANSGANTGPSIFTALEEQLGLKLVSSKGPVDTLVIDHVEMPTEN